MRLFDYNTYYKNKHNMNYRISIIIESFICGYFIMKYMGFFDMNVPLSQLENDLLTHPYKFSKIYIDESYQRVYFALNSTYLEHDFDFYKPNYLTSKMSSLSDYGVKLRKILESEYANKSIIYGVPYDMINLLYDITFWIIVYIIISLLYGKLCGLFTTRPVEKSLDDDDYNGLFSGLLDNDTPCYQIIKSDDPILSNIDPVICSAELKSSLDEYISYMNNYDTYVSVGFRPPKGILFVGPPGTGKTMLAKEFAKKCDATFITTCASNFIEKYIGSGQTRIKKLFKEARKYPKCIIFIDEIDSIGNRNSVNSHGGSQEYITTLNTLLTEIDGFSNNENILIIAATNFMDNIDKALLRSGRFDKKIIFDIPNIHERKEILTYYLSKILLSNNFMDQFETNVDKLAKMTAGLTGADIKNIVNQGISNFLCQNPEALSIINNIIDKNNINKSDIDKNDIDKNNSECIVNNIGTSNIQHLLNISSNPTCGTDIQHLLNAIDDIIIGMIKKERLMTDKEKEIIAYHEAGHTLMACLMKDVEIPLKTSIIPRGENALGFTQQEPNDKKLYTKSYMLSRLYVLLGGRIAEAIKFGPENITSGASDDLDKATKLAYNMVTSYGMESTIGLINTDKNTHSEWLKQKINITIRITLDNISSNVKKLMENPEFCKYLEDIAAKLLENEEIIKNDIYDIIPEKYHNVIIPQCHVIPN